ncbi:amidase [Pokkaliibacter plantistimulans]|uniref:Amidase n=1 Tax=Proteobacteria bacterium 228 TaxID=2083153 RepID=A0A2S5KMX3_9PROT|nr:amidase [Pokkaliibacter plantistimulans]PPC76148.1 amidase [Pokkaliibacter plantistimulans]
MSQLHPFFDRRQFLKSSAALAASSALPTLAKASAPAPTGGINSAEQLLILSASELSALIRSRQVSCQEVMKSYLAQIQRVNPKVNAIVALQPEEALMQQARQADDDLTRGHYRGWMHGFPHAVKDLAATRGITTTLGSPLLKDWKPGHDATFVERLKAAGAIIIGKTNTPEFGLGSQTYNSVYGTTRNAFDHRLCAGGSSGGAAVSVATAMVPVADGSDMMGSLRNPAAFNNIIGFRPSQGRVPFAPTAEAFVQQLGYEGPMGRTVTDVAMLLSTMAGRDDRAPLSLANPAMDFSLRLHTSTRGMRVAWLGDFNGYLATEPGVLSLCESALTHFRDVGVEVDSVVLDYPMDEVWQTWLTLRHWLVAGGAGSLYAREANRAQMKPEALWEIEGGLQLSAMDVFKASEARTRWYLQLLKLFDSYDAVLLPSAQVFAFDADTHWPHSINGRTMDTYHRWMEVVVPGTLSGCPIASIPAGFDTQGRAMGMQLIGRPCRDDQVLQLAYAYEQATHYLQRKPAI